MVITRKPRAQRYRVDGMTVIYDAHGSFWSGPVRDMSETGLFVVTSHTLALGHVVPLIADAHGDEDLPFELRGEVVRVQPHDVEDLGSPASGLAFRLLVPGTAQVAIRQFLTCCGIPLNDLVLIEPG